MGLIHHDDVAPTHPAPGITRRMIVDRATGAGGISTGLVVLEPGAIIAPHTHLVEESITVLEGDVRFLIGDDYHEVRGGNATLLAPGNIVHGIRNVGTGPARIAIAYPSVEVTATRVDREI